MHRRRHYDHMENIFRNRYRYSSSWKALGTLCCEIYNGDLCDDSLAAGYKKAVPRLKIIIQECDING